MNFSRTLSRLEHGGDPMGINDVTDASGAGSAGRLVAESPRKIILVGSLGADEVASLVNYCVRLHASGQTEVHMDLGGVIDCDRAGLEGLRVLTSRSTGLLIFVVGARWGQFMTMLSTEPTADIVNLCESVRELVSTAPASRSRPEGGDAPPSAQQGRVIWRRENVTETTSQR